MTFLQIFIWKTLDDLFVDFFSTLQIVKNTDFEKPLDRVYWKALDDLFVDF